MPYFFHPISMFSAPRSDTIGKNDPSPRNAPAHPVSPDVAGKAPARAVTQPRDGIRMIEHITDRGYFTLDHLAADVEPQIRMHMEHLLLRAHYAAGLLMDLDAHDRQRVIRTTAILHALLLDLALEHHIALNAIAAAHIRRYGRREDPRSADIPADDMAEQKRSESVTTITRIRIITGNRNMTRERIRASLLLPDSRNHAAPPRDESAHGPGTAAAGAPKTGESYPAPLR
jgi:hypothetical protein